MGLAYNAAQYASLLRGLDKLKERVRELTRRTGVR